MNNQRNMTDDELRLITSRRLPQDAALSDELAAIQDAFRSLGESLACATPPLDEQALLGRLTELAAPDVPQIAARMQARPRHSWRPAWLVVAGALAAAALVAIVRVPQAPLAPPVAATSSHHAPRDEAPIKSSPPSYNWHDPIDEEIAIAAATMTRLSGKPRGLDASLVDMNESLSALAQELYTENL
jgi:hypothetical protein